MTTLPVSASRIHAHAIRSAFSSGNFAGAEYQFVILRHSLPQFAYSETYPHLAGEKASYLPSVRLPAHTYIHGVLRNNQPAEYALREVGWMLSWGFRVRLRTLDAVFRAAGRKAIVEGRKEAEAEAEAEGRPSALNRKFEAKKFKRSVQNLQDKDQDLARALLALRLVRLHGYKGPTSVSVEMYKFLVEACMRRDKYLTAVLTFEMMIEDWVGSLSPPTTPSAGAPSATTPSPATPSATPVSLSPAPMDNADIPLLTPVKFADLTHGIFNMLCGTFKRRLWSTQPVPNQTPEDMEEAKQYQSIIIKSTLVLVSLLDRRHLPYYNFRKLLELMYMCTRTTPRRLHVVSRGVQERLVVRKYLKRVAASLVNDLGTRDISLIPEISQMLRWRDTLLPHFNLDTYRALLDLVYHAFRSPDMGAKVIKFMAKDERTMRIALDKEVCFSLVAWPTRLRMMGLDNALYNFVWNTSGIDPQLPTSLALPHDPKDEAQQAETETERPKPRIYPEIEPHFGLIEDLKLQLESYEASRPLPLMELIQEQTSEVEVSFEGLKVTS